MGSDSLLGFIFRPIIYIKKGYKCQPSSDRFFYKIPFFKCSLIYRDIVNNVYNYMIYIGNKPLFKEKLEFTMVKVHQNQVTQSYTILTQYNYINMFLYCCSFVHLDR